MYLSSHLAEHLAQGLGEQALANLLSFPPEQHVAQLEQCEAFVLGQRRNASEVNDQAKAESINKTQDELLREKARNEALNRTVETLSARSNQPRPIRMDPPKFDETAPHTIVHWLLLVEQCPPNDEILLQARFFGARQAKRSLQEYVKEMRSLSAFINVSPIPGNIRVPMFMNGLRHGPSRLDLFKKVPKTMEEAISIAMDEEQSYNIALATAFYKPSAEKSDATPMELGNADVVCNKCGKRGHMMPRCYAKLAADAMS
ncbi:unnamed protein product [Peronospora farinosa]|uniref:CCHC-type domain-containing protein n=1 Tax=Peronospora farinosa TaxID=134698 RepID=A0AAV0UY67_9STRA|nr:unnamed protein product [Peronospora farinosa]